MIQRIFSLIKENRGFVIFIVLMVVFRSSFADWNQVPTGSMKPTIMEGDRILVNKMAYDIRIPLTYISVFKIGDPATGDIIVFDSEVSDKRLVKRVVGVPGDRVQLSQNILSINGQVLQYQNVSSHRIFDILEESLNGVKHLVTINKFRSPMSSFSELIVPQDHYLVLGDNRDNSADSRVIGFVPRDKIIGRSKTVVLSLDYDNYYLPRTNRFLHTL